MKLKDIIYPTYVEWSEKQLGLISEIENNYNPRKGMISVSITNRIFDGRHRYLILFNKFGGDYKVIVRKIFFSKRIYNTIIWLIIPLLLIISFILNTQEKTLNENN